MTKPADSKPTSASAKATAPQGRRYDETFKLDAVRMREQSGRSRAEVARDLGVSQVTLAAWEASHGTGGAGAGAGTRSAATRPGAGPAGAVAALAEVARLRAELEHISFCRYYSGFPDTRPAP